MFSVPRALSHAQSQPNVTSFYLRRCQVPAPFPGCPVPWIPVLPYSGAASPRPRGFQGPLPPPHSSGNSLIAFRSKKLIQESDQHLKDVEKILQNDKRYLVLDCVPEERRKLIVSYVDDLDRRGPPPPPTASEPTRRTTK